MATENLRFDMHSRLPNHFSSESFWGWGGILLFFSVPRGFPSGSQGVPNSITLLSHMLCSKLNFHVYKL
jgi:hypothetical protein